MQAQIFNWIFKSRYVIFERNQAQAIISQQNLWKELVHLAQATEFGKKYAFKDIYSLKDFQQAIPPQSYEDLQVSILEMIDGRANVLWPGKIRFFAKSSGTSSSKSKFIPISKSSLEQNHFKGGKDMISIYARKNAHKNVFSGKNLSVSGTFDKNSSGVMVGDLSSVLLLNLPVWVQNNRLPSIELSILTDWESKIDQISTEIIDQNISSLSGVQSWNLILLKQVLQKSGAANLQELWPNFQLYMHGGVNFEPYRKRFEDIIGPKSFTFLETYNASEGFFAIQDQLDKDSKGMALLCNHGVFYEFVPKEEWGKTNPSYLSLQDVQLGQNYVLLISTKSGLWRYVIGDTVRFTSLHPFRIVLTGRIQYFINLFGEELVEENANIALQKVCSQLQCSIKEYTVGPIYPDANGKGAHEWLLEFEKFPDDFTVFGKLLDQTLKNLNSDYEAKRSGNIALQAPIVSVVPNGTFLAWLKAKGKVGGQHKVPRLQNSRKIIEEIRAMR